MALFGKSNAPKRKARTQSGFSKLFRKSPKPSNKTSLQYKKQVKSLSVGRLVLKFLLLLCLFASVLFAIWLWQLDQRIQTGFNAPFRSVPAHIYARPYTLQAGDAQSITEIEAELIKQGYRHVKNISHPGEYAYAGDVIDIYGQRTVLVPSPLAVRLLLRNGQIEQIVDHKNARIVEKFELSDNLIGTLKSGPIEDRIVLTLGNVPEVLLDALITMEDKRFMSHLGVDPLGIVRAMVQNIRDGRVSQGASTLTQQLVKNLFLDSSRTLKRKINEAVMALIIEWRYDKSEILERYVNTIFLGQSGNRAIHGFGLAAQFYYGHNLRDLNLGQLAQLVGMIPAPSLYNPFRNHARAIARRNLVLDTLYKNGYISVGELDLHKQSELEVVESEVSGSRRYAAFSDLLNRQLLENYDRNFLQASGLRVYSTLDEQIQRSAQTQFRTALDELESVHDIQSGTLQGAMIIARPDTGEIVALIGGRKELSGGFNRALDAWRPIGSLVKPAVYLTALLNPERYSMASMIEDAPVSIELPTGDSWQPQNYDKEYHGEVSLYDALIHSYNVPAVKVGLDVGLAAVATTLQRLGIDDVPPEYPSMLLGASNLNILQVTQMFQTIANQGKWQPLTTLRAVSNDDNETLMGIRSGGEQMVNMQANYLLRSIMVEVARSGTARMLGNLMPGLQLAGKTGTTNDYRDSWFAGFGDNYLAVVWLGTDDNSSIGLTGASGALRVWANVMSEIDLHSVDMNPPEGIAEVEIDLLDGQLAVAGCTEESAMRYFVSGYEPISNANCTAVVDEVGDWLKRWFGQKQAKSAEQKRDIPVTDGFEDDR